MSVHSVRPTALDLMMRGARPFGELFPHQGREQTSQPQANTPRPPKSEATVIPRTKGKPRVFIDDREIPYVGKGRVINKFNRNKRTRNRGEQTRRRRPGRHRVRARSHGR